MDGGLLHDDSTPLTPAAGIPARSTDAQLIRADFEAILRTKEAAFKAALDAKEAEYEASLKALKEGNRGVNVEGATLTWKKWGQKRQALSQEKSQRGLKGVANTEMPTWSAASWMVSSTHMVDLFCEHLLTSVPGNGSEADKIKALTKDQIYKVLDDDQTLKNLAAEVYHGVERLNSCEEVDASKLNAKFAADKNGFTYVYGDMDIYHGGLEGRYNLWTCFKTSLLTPPPNNRIHWQSRPKYIRHDGMGACQQSVR
jgi:hypothetical protein